MSFDDVARRMQQRHQPTYEQSAPLPPPSPDAFAASLRRAEIRSRAHSNLAWGPIVAGVIKLIRGFVYLGES